MYDMIIKRKAIKMKRLEGTQIPRYTVVIDISTQEDKDIVDAFDRVIRGTRKRNILDLMQEYTKRKDYDFGLTQDEINESLHIEVLNETNE